MDNEFRGLGGNNSPQKKKNLICISQKRICIEDFFVRVEKILQADIFAFILREKDLSAQEYRELALKLLSLTRKYPTPLFLNGYFDLACKLGLGTQIPFNFYEKLQESPVPVGISIHSVKEAEYIVSTPKDVVVSYILAGHIFPTDCKKGLEPRGLDFLSEVCKVVGKKFPVFALGGISPEKMPAVYEAGAHGGAIMGSCMQTENFTLLLEGFLKVTY